MALTKTMSPPQGPCIALQRRELSPRQAHTHHIFKAHYSPHGMVASSSSEPSEEVRVYGTIILCVVLGFELLQPRAGNLGI